MTRIGLTFLVGVAGLVVLAAAAEHGLSGPACLAAALATWVALLASVRLINAAWVARKLRVEGPEGPTADMLASARRVLAAAEDVVALGRPMAEPLARAVLILAPEHAAPDEDEVVRALLRSTPEERRRLVYDLRRAQQDAVDGLAAAFGPLRDSARAVLRLLGHPAPSLFGHLAAGPAWAGRRAFVNPDEAEVTIAQRLVRHGMARAAIAATDLAAPTARARRLALLARLLRMLEHARRGELVSLSGPRRTRTVEDLILLAGPRTPELLPGSQLFDSLPDGSETLRRIVAARPRRLAELARVAEEDRELTPRVASVLAFALGWRPGSVVTALRAGAPEFAQDGALVALADGLVALDGDEVETAARAFERALVESRDLLPAAYGLAVTRRRQGRESDGESTLRYALARRSAMPDSWLLLARFLAGGPVPSKARKVYEEAVRRFPRSVRLRVAYARDLSDWGDDDDALDHLQEAREHAPDDAQLAFFAGRLAGHQGRLDEALDALEAAENGLSGTELAEARYHRMNALRELGDHATALRLAFRLSRRLGRGQAHLLDDVAEYLEERREYLRAREAAQRARRLRGDQSL